MRLIKDFNNVRAKVKVSFTFGKTPAVVCCNLNVHIACWVVDSIQLYWFLIAVGLTTP